MIKRLEVEIVKIKKSKKNHIIQSNLMMVNTTSYVMNVNKYVRNKLQWGSIVRLSVKSMMTNTKLHITLKTT